MTGRKYSTMNIDCLEKKDASFNQNIDHRGLGKNYTGFNRSSRMILASLQALQPEAGREGVDQFAMTTTT